MLTSAMEDYLKSLYKLQREQERVTTTAVAKAMEVSAASATNMVKRLAELHLVEHEPYKGVVLTAAGRLAALEIVRHHRLIELFLQQALGYSWDEVDAEAERLEHAITQEFAERIELALGHPTHDPHGHPIPTRDLEIDEHGGSTRLSDVAAGQRVRVRLVDDGSPALLRDLAALGLVPGSELEVLESVRGGALQVRLGTRSSSVTRELARHVTIDPL